MVCLARVRAARDVSIECQVQQGAGTVMGGKTHFEMSLVMSEAHFLPVFSDATSLSTYPHTANQRSKTHDRV
jgi:hypothetical protein